MIQKEYGLYNITVSNDIISRVKALVLESTGKAFPFYHGQHLPSPLLPGKMLRTAFAARISEHASWLLNIDTGVNACTAVELVHTASLLHDDVIDRGLIRRGVKTFWKAINPSVAVLTGDLLLCVALDLIQKTEKGRYSELFTDKVSEVCRAEVEQELVFRGKELDESICLRLAREKTGPLFAITGKVCGGDNQDLSSALEESGYLVGTAYQLADDLLDIIGDENVCGKTLGTDFGRGKSTLPHILENPQEIIDKISDLCNSAQERLDEWPDAEKGLENFIECDLGPVFNRISKGIKVMSC
ncbi:MAG TPA: hypothetical protein ENH82_16195 [bacterium]|nr:hypothetical protein [bacterium]